MKYITGPVHYVGKIPARTELEVIRIEYCRNAEHKSHWSGLAVDRDTDFEQLEYCSHPDCVARLIHSE